MKKGSNNFRPIKRVRNSFVRQILTGKRLIPGAIIAMLIVLACIHIWQRVYVMELGREVSVLRKTNHDLTDLLKKKHSEITEFSRLSRIEKIAGEKLNLGRTSSENMYTIIREESYKEINGIENLLHSLKKVADNMPVINESKAVTMDLFQTDEDQD